MIVMREIQLRLAWLANGRPPLRRLCRKQLSRIKGYRKDLRHRVFSDCQQRALGLRARANYHDRELCHVELWPTSLFKNIK